MAPSTELASHVEDLGEVGLLLCSLVLAMLGNYHQGKVISASNKMKKLRKEQVTNAFSNMNEDQKWS